MRGLDPRIHDEAQIQNPCDCDRMRCRMDGRVKPGHDGGNDHAPWARHSGTARQRRTRNDQQQLFYLSGSGMNSISSPGTFSKWPAFQSALACSMRSLRDETKFHQMWRGPSIGAPPRMTKWVSV